MLLRAGGTTGLEAETGKTDQRADLEVEKDAPGPEAETVLPSLPDLERGCPRQEPTATGKEEAAGKREAEQKDGRKKAAEREKENKQVSDSSSESEKEEETEAIKEKETVAVVLTEAELNTLASKVLKAELMGNDELAAELKLKLEAARAARA